MDELETIKPQVRVGVGVLIENDQGQVLLGLRQGSHGEGEWSFPGGHLEFGEPIFETAKREVLEEAGITIDELELISVADEMRYIETDGKHYLNLGVKECITVESRKYWNPIGTKNGDGLIWIIYRREYSRGPI